MSMFEQKKLKPFILTAIIIFMDQISKAFIVAHWPKEGTFIKDVFGNDFLWIIHARNKAIAFSLGENLPDNIKTILFIIVPCIVLVLLVVYYFRSSEFTSFQQWLITGIIGGGIGNLLDRIFRPEGVVDFISVNVYGFLGFSRWPTFNLADSSVVVCAILLFISLLGKSETNKEV